ncbi:MAG: hypothetical protein Q4E46_01305 [Candidatus Saccharibacteria bacterium]|nr:hypothetical protein [Candidatus Saccharibacteria bacterium]
MNPQQQPQQFQTAQTPQATQRPQATAQTRPAMPGRGTMPTPQTYAQQQQLLQQQAAQLASQGKQNAPNAANATKVPDLPTSTQASLLISELRDGLVIMKDGSFRAVVACQSINFDLMSSTEREGVEYSFQNFLNSLNFTTQILIRSQRVDIAPYIERLAEIRRNNDNMLLGVLMDDYINFIDVLSQEANIMDKSFFIVIPYYTNADAEKALQQAKSIFRSLSGKQNDTPEVTRIDRQTYDKAITEINNRVESVVSGLFQIGIHAVRLNTKELAGLYYNFNNPDTAVREPLVDFSKLATTYVRKGENAGN